MSIPTRRDIICFAFRWDDQWRRTQQIMARLAEDHGINKILYIEEPLTILSLFKCLLGKGDADARCRWKRLFHREPLEVRPTLSVLTPLIPIPYVPIKPLNRLYRALVDKCIALCIRRRIKRLGIQQPIIWVSWPFFSQTCFDRIPGQLLCYDVCEDFSKFGSHLPPAMLDEVINNDQRLSSEADLLTCNSEGLLVQRKKLNRNAYLLLNGVDEQFFRNPSFEGGRTASEIDNIPSPVIGFVGSISRRLDLDLLVKIAEANPQFSFVLVGDDGHPVPGLDQLRAMQNIYFLGRKPYHFLPTYIERFDICLSFYHVNDLNDTGTSLKLFQYAALGKPILTTPTAGAGYYEHVVRTFGGVEEFTRVARELLANDSQERRNERMAFAQQNTWEARTKEVKELLNHQIGAERICN